MAKKTKTLIREAWTGKKAPLVGESFTAEVTLDGDKAIPLQEMANRHEEAGYEVTRTVFDKMVPSNWGYDNLVTFIRISIKRRQTEMAYA